MPNLGCCAGLHIWRRAGVLSRTRGWVGYSPTCTVNETMAESATAPTPASLETQFGPEVLGAGCKPCLEQTKPRADCLWISALLPTQTYAGEKTSCLSPSPHTSSSSLAVELPYESQDLEGDHFSPLHRMALLQVQHRLILQRGVG